MRKKGFILSILLGIFICFVPPASGQDSLSERQKNEIDLDRIGILKEIQARNEEAVLRTPGVVGIGIGLTEDGHNLAFIVYVQKLTPSVEEQVSRTIENVPVRLVESGIFRAY